MARRRVAPICAFVVAPLGALAVVYLVELIFGPPGEALGFTGTTRHLVTGVSAGALLIVAGVLVGRRAYVQGMHGVGALVLGVLTVAMTYVWGLVLFVLGASLTSPHAG